MLFSTRGNITLSLTTRIGKVNDAVFDFVETGISISDGGDSSAIVRDNPNPEWEKAFAKACLYFTTEDFPAFSKLELVDLGWNGRLIPRTLDNNVDSVYAIDLDRNLFHERYSMLYSNCIVASHPIQDLTTEIMEKLRCQDGVEDGFYSQSFPLPNEYKQAIIDDLFNQGYRFYSEVRNSYAPILWRVIEEESGCERCAHIFLPTATDEQFFNPLHERHMAVAELLMTPNPHPHLVNVRKILTVHGNPAVIIDRYDSDLESAKDKLSRQQINCVIAQVVKGVIFLHQHGAIHHDIKPSNILINYNDRNSNDETKGGGMVEAAIYDFQSVSVPSPRYQKEENNENICWGPFSHPPSREKPDTHVHRDDRWLPGWAPMKTSFRFLRRDFRTANPWTIDCSSVAMMFLLNNIEIYHAYQESSVSDYRDHPEFSVFFNVVNLFQSHARSARDAIEELESTVRTLSDMESSVTDDGK